MVVKRRAGKVPAVERRISNAMAVPPKERVFAKRTKQFALKGGAGIRLKGTRPKDFLGSLQGGYAWQATHYFRDRRKKSAAGQKKERQ